MTTVTDKGLAEPAQYRIVGTRAPRLDGLEKVTGAARFGADIYIAGMLHGKMLTSPHAHARILSIDTREAEAIARRKGRDHRQGLPHLRTAAGYRFHGRAVSAAPG